jgi:hypothetical protein
MKRYWVTLAMQSTLWIRRLPPSSSRCRIGVARAIDSLIAVGRVGPVVPVSSGIEEDHPASVPRRPERRRLSSRTAANHRDVNRVGSRHVRLALARVVHAP